MSKIRRMLCAWFGHPRVITQCFGYIHCARCEQLLGDTLAGAYPATKCVLVGHDCQHCRENRAALVWHEKLLVRWQQPTKKELEADRKVLADAKQTLADLRREREAAR